MKAPAAGPIRSARRRSFLLLLPACLLLLTGGPGRGAEEWRRDLDYQERLRIADLIRSLDASYPARRPAVRELVALGTGPSADLVREQLIEALERENSQIRTGAIEVMARIGNPAFVSPLADHLPFETFMDNRILLMRLLPSFLVAESGYHAEVLTTLLRDQYSVEERVRRILCQRPLRPDGRHLDPHRMRLRQQITEALAGQLDPIGSAVEGFDTQAHDAVAREWVQRMLLARLEESREASRETWRHLRPRARLRSETFIPRTQETAGSLLADIGALAAWPELERLGEVRRPEAAETALAALGSLTLLAQERWEENAAVLRGSRLAPEDLLDAERLREELLASTEGARLLALLPADVRQALGGGGAEAADLLTAMNALLERPGLHRDLELPASAVPAESRGLLERPVDELSAVQVRHLNRLVLEMVFPRALRRHRSWRDVDAAESSWRRDEQKRCRAVAEAGYRLACRVLADRQVAQAPPVRRQAYRMIGAARWPAAVPLLLEEALHRERRAALRADIAWALGQIGGVEAAQALGQLAVYKGYGATMTERQEEYRGVVAAIDALGRIAGRAGDEGAAVALQELLRILGDGRALAELQDLPPFSRHAQRALQVHLREGRSTLSEEAWRRAQREHLAAEASRRRESIPPPPAAPSGQDGRAQELSGTPGG